MKGQDDQAASGRRGVPARGVLTHLSRRRSLLDWRVSSEVQKPRGRNVLRDLRPQLSDTALPPGTNALTIASPGPQIIIVFARC